jgi:hypothetical protein
MVELHQKKDGTTFQIHATHQKLVAHAKTKVKEPFKIEHAFPKLVANGKLIIIIRIRKWKKRDEKLNRKRS